MLGLPRAALAEEPPGAAPAAIRLATAWEEPAAVPADICDTPGPRPIRHVAFNLSDSQDAQAAASLQRALQLCVRTAPAPWPSVLRGPVRRG